MVEATRTIKAIETEYKGYRFRSRLEARWAVFFDACGVKWEYEPEGFDLGDGLYYLPDFLLHDVWIRNHTPHDLWVEVKGQMTEEDARKIIKFAAEREDFCGCCDVELYEHPILVVTNIPNNSDDVFNIAYNEPEPYPFNFYLIDGDYFGACPCITWEGHFALVGHDGNYTADRDDEATEKAYRIARQARFEHGEQPKPTFNREVFGKPNTVVTTPIATPKTPAVSFELQRFFEDKIVYMHNYSRLQSGDSTRSKQEWKAEGWFDVPSNFAAELSPLEKDFGASRIMEAANNLVGISTEFRCTMIDAFSTLFIDSHRHECVQKFICMIRDWLTKHVDTKENTQMEVPKPTDEPAQDTIPALTVADIEDISARAEATAKIFGVSKTDAIRAVIKLKSKEINRDLAPLLELLEKNNAEQRQWQTSASGSIFEKVNYTD